MAKLEFDLKGGQTTEPFECTGCKQIRGIGMDYLELHIMDQISGPFCLECWPKVPKMLETVAQHPEISMDVDAISNQIMSRYQAAKGRVN